MNVLMMRRLQERARQEAKSAAADRYDLASQLASLLEREELLLHRLDLVEHANERAQSYKPMHCQRYRCPCCAVYSDVEIELAEIAAPSGYRKFVCSYCGNDFVFATELRSFGIAHG